MPMSEFEAERQELREQRERLLSALNQVLTILRDLDSPLDVRVNMCHDVAAEALQQAIGEAQSAANVVAEEQPANPLKSSAVLDTPQALREAARILARTIAYDYRQGTDDAHQQHVAERLVQWAQKWSASAGDSLRGLIAKWRKEAGPIRWNGMCVTAPELARCADELEALIDPPSVDSLRGWQDIETAPKDGTRVLLWFAGNWPRAVIGAYRDGGWIGYWSLDEEVMVPEPTHWMPLPQPPDPPAPREGLSRET